MSGDAEMVERVAVAILGQMRRDLRKRADWRLESEECREAFRRAARVAILAAAADFYTCPHCGRISANAGDKAERFCAACGPADGVLGPAPPPGWAWR